MSSPDSTGSAWSIISHHEQEKEAALHKQAAILEQHSSDGESAAAPTATHFEPATTAPGPIPIPSAHRDPKRAATKEFPTVGPDDDRSERRDEPHFICATGEVVAAWWEESVLVPEQSCRKERESKVHIAKKQAFVIPPPLSPEPDAVIVRRPGSESNGTTPEPPVAPKASRGPRPPVTTYSTKLYSNQYAQPTQQPTQSSRPRKGSFSSPMHSHQSSSEPAKTERPPSRNKSRGSREIPIVELSGRNNEAPPIEREPVLGALQSHRVNPNKATYAPPASAPTQPTIRPLPSLPATKPTVTLVPPPQPAAAPPPPQLESRPNPPPNTAVATPVPQPVRPPPESLHPAAHYSDPQQHYQPTQRTVSNPPVVRYKTSSDRTSYTTTATTPSLSSSVKTHGSQGASDAPPKGAERVGWAAAPPTRPAMSGHTRAATLDQVNASEAWNQSYNSYRYETHHSSPPKSKPNKLQRHATTAASTPSAAVTHYYYDPSPPLITRNTRLSELKEDYRNPGSERSSIIRRKINYLRFELGYTGLRRARGDGNCFYRSFAFCYLEQILFAEDRALAVINALDNLEIAQNLVEAALPDNKFSKQMHLFLRDLIRNIELGKTDQKKLLRTFQDMRDSDDIVAYVRLLASAYIRLTTEMHASVFHPDDPTVIVSPIEFCISFVEEMGQDADHLQISALSRTLNVAIYIYRLDEKIDGVAPNEQDIPAHCTRFTPTDVPLLTEPVALLFRPGHYDILERHPEQI
ncbi:peptidase C65 otubain protein [Rhizoctonia solani]|uniref:ubiquitinyl hydrolase 1 n=1 Tax=Rhizoctonia solani TaxID=456999 RepID=A0A8H8STH5_9AGAM|nr:peptidase C65 otubain protein [Rhizoctonia solani]QRW17891.1 peptidase C65 otubain protein [Rhizoctonia solani]